MTLSPSLAALGTLRRFITYRVEPDLDRPGKTHKFPTHWQSGWKCDPIDPANWTDYATAHATGRPVGFVFTKADGFWFLDVDGALQADGQTWSALANELCARLPGAAVEVSQSGRGLHLFGRGAIPAHSCKNVALGLELYSDRRFVALTGINAIGDANIDLGPQLASVINDYFPPNPHGEIAGWTDTPVPEWKGPVDDAELIKAAMASGKRNAAAAFGGVHVSFADLWLADEAPLSQRWPGTTGGYDASHADAALAGHLAYWTGKNCERIRELMYQSSLAREKWDNRPDWLETTIMKACAVVKNVAEGRRPAEAIPPDVAKVAIEAGPLVGFVFDGDAPIAPSRELVKHMLPVEGVAFLGGQSGAGKTFVAVDLAIALASKNADHSNCGFFGRKICERVGVAIFAAEGFGTLTLRIKAAKKHRGLHANLPIAHLGDVPDLANMAQIDLVGTWLVALNDEFRRKFGVRLGLIVIDTVAAAFNLADENNNAEASRVLRNMRKLGDVSGALILAVHHYGKNADTGLRGASAFKAGADAILSVLAIRNDTTGTVRNRSISLAKSRTSDEGPISGFDLKFTPFGIDGDDEMFGSCVVIPNNAPIAHRGADKESASIAKFREAFKAALNDHGVASTNPATNETTRTVLVTHVQANFTKSYGSETTDERKRAENARKAFSRTLEKLPVEFVMSEYGKGDRWIWQLS